MSSPCPAFAGVAPLQLSRPSLLHHSAISITTFMPLKSTRAVNPIWNHIHAATAPKCQMPTNVESIPAERIPSDLTQFPPQWHRPGVYGIYSVDKTLQYVAAVRDVHDAIATHVRLIKDMDRVFAVRMLTIADVDAAPLGDIAENWVRTHVEYEGIPPGNGDQAPEWRAEEWTPDVLLRKGEDVAGEIRSVLRRNRAVLFMKGKRDAPRCGFSDRTVSIMKDLLEDEFVCVDCLDQRNVGLRDGIKKYSEWPTIPQLYVDGDFVGGCDIVSDMYQSGALGKLVAPIVKAKKLRAKQQTMVDQAATDPPV